MRKKIAGIPVMGIIALSLLAVGAVGAYVLYWQQIIDPVAISFYGLDGLMALPTAAGYAAKTSTSALQTATFVQNSDLLDADYDYVGIYVITGQELEVGQPIRIALSSTHPTDVTVSATGFWCAVTTDVVMVFDDLPFPIPVNENGGSEYFELSYATTQSNLVWTTPEVIPVGDIHTTDTNCLIVQFTFDRIGTFYGSVEYNLDVSISGEE